ncbi:hypothetical protein [Marinivivus vitaminiproducens]|uniref:hypothetical protein n=1 Tax=Marinivivus vitaminiproducens TaxID=3035935 RepID=UPI002798DA6C|nr:hypothetical protein P4R82_24960 [Geminicoccaceae bacterium SCSIO 64248]
MATKTRSSNATAHTTSRSEPITLERTRLVCPDDRIAASIARHFGIELPAYTDIRDMTMTSLIAAADALKDSLNEKALAMHLQRIVGAHIQSAYHAGQFYGRKVSEARDVTAKGANDDRDEDRGGVAGFDSRAERVRTFAAQIGLQAYAQLAAADGAVAAYAHAVGEPWKPYVSDVPPTAQVDRQAAQAQIAAFE